MSARHRPHDRHERDRRDLDRSDRDRRDRDRSGPTRPNAASNERELERTLDDLLGEISRLPAPDVSQTVLARLGYRPIDRRTLRRRRIASLVRRVGGVTVSLMLLGTGLFVIDESRRAAAPAVAIDEAVRESVERRSELLGGVAAGLRPLSELPGRLAASLGPAIERPAADAAPDPARFGDATVVRAVATTPRGVDVERSPWPAIVAPLDTWAEVRADRLPDPEPSPAVAVPMVPSSASPRDWGGGWRPGFRPEWPIGREAPLRLDAPRGNPLGGPLGGPVAAIAPLKKT